MKSIKLHILLTFCLIFFSCNNKVISVFYYDTAKVNDGEIGAQSTYLFFKKGERNFNIKINSNPLKTQLQKIKHDIDLRIIDYDFDDGFYGYAFITATEDTLYADYSWRYWRYNGKGILYMNDTLKTIFEKTKKQFKILN